MRGGKGENADRDTSVAILTDEGVADSDPDDVAMP